MSTAAGREGERLASLLLRESGHTILTRNYRGGEGEIDLVAMDGAILVFVEVKSRPGAIGAAAAVDARKVARIASAAASFLREMELSPEEVRFDIVTIDGSTGAATHHRDAFRP